ncbi:MAG: CBM35 domain-containing protein [Balneolales bacterium]
MNFLKYYLIMALLMIAIVGPSKALAQDEEDIMYIEWMDEEGPINNAIRDAVRGDTLANGERANLDRVYMLRKGGYYIQTDRIENNGFPLRIVGEPGPYTDADHPPIIRGYHYDEGGQDQKLLVANGDVTLKNLYIIGRTNLGNENYETIRFDADEAHIEIDNVVFEYAQWGIIAFYGKNSTIHVRNSTFRNFLSSAQLYGGRILSVWADTKELVIEHNNFYNIGGLGVQVEGGDAELFWLNHNTFVNIGRNPILGSTMIDGYVTNNLFVNTYWHGEDETNFTQQRLDQPDLYYGGQFNIGPLNRQGLDAQRKIKVSNNAQWLDPAFENYYYEVSADSFVRGQPFVNERTQGYFDNYENMIYQNHIEGEDPGFANNPDLTTEMIAYIESMRGSGEEIVRYFYDDWEGAWGASDPENTEIWPLMEDFSYNNAQLQTAAFGDYPLGNLNWFPDEYESWKQEEDQIAEDIKQFSSETTVDFIANVEAENGTLSGSENEIAIVDAQDQFSANMQGTGYVEWEIDIETAGTYDVSISTYAGSNRANNLVVNGVDLGQFAPIEDAPTDWYDLVTEDVALDAGTNTVRITPNWGYTRFGSVSILDGEETLVSKLADQATLEGISLSCEGSLCASESKYVEMKSGGSLSFNFNDMTAGEHALTVTYFLPTTEMSQEVYVNGTLASTVNFTGVDSLWTTVDILGLQFEEGSNEVEIRSVDGQTNFDFVDLFKVTTTGIDNRKELPGSYALSKNYPNPFNPTTMINFTLPQATAVKLTVYDVLGRQVAVLTDGHLQSGVHTVTFDATNMASGMYLYRLETANFTAVEKMMLIK